MSEFRVVLLLIGSVAATSSSAQSYDFYSPASTGDGSLMLVVWDITNGATLVDRVSGYSLNDIASQPYVFFKDGLPANAIGREVQIGSMTSTVTELDGRRLPWPFSVGQQLSDWGEFVRLSSGDPVNFRFSVSAGDNNSDGAQTLDGAEAYLSYKAIAFTSNAFDLEDDPLDEDFYTLDVNDGARAHDEYFGSSGALGMTTEVHSAPIWNGSTGTAPHSADRRSALYPGDDMENDDDAQSLGLNWGEYMGQGWNAAHELIDDSIPESTAGRIGEPVNFWVFSSGWSVDGNSDVPKTEQFPYQWTLDADGCLRYNAYSCAPISAPEYITEEWPKPLPNGWTLGWVSDVAVDSQNHIWVLNRPTVFANQTNDNPSGQPVPLHRPAPAVIEFNQAGEILRFWGGQAWDSGSQSWFPSIDGWPFNYEHGIYIDAEDNVWITWAIGQHLVMKFTPEGEPLLTIGRVGETGGNDNTELLGGPADVVVDEVAREVFVADGYVNQRVIVFDSDTGEFKRQWGAYGRPPVVDDSNDRESVDPNERFVGPVHGIAMATDGLIYVVDREALRTQVFRKDGTFVSEIYAPAFDVALSPDQDNQLLYLGRAGDAGGALMLGGGVFMLDRRNPGVAAYFGETSIDRLHGMAVDQSGNVYTAELRFGVSKQVIRPN